MTRLKGEAFTNFLHDVALNSNYFRAMTDGEIARKHHVSKATVGYWREKIREKAREMLRQTIEARR